MNRGLLAVGIAWGGGFGCTMLFGWQGWVSFIVGGGVGAFIMVLAEGKS